MMHYIVIYMHRMTDRYNESSPCSNVYVIKYSMLYVKEVYACIREV
jgi:hypothetical protein